MFNVVRQTINAQGHITGTSIVAAIDSLTIEALATVCEVIDFEVDEDNEGMADAFVKIGKCAPEIVSIERVK